MGQIFRQMDELTNKNIRILHLTPLQVLTRLIRTQTSWDRYTDRWMNWRIDAHVKNLCLDLWLRTTDHEISKVISEFISWFYSCLDANISRILVCKPLYLVFWSVSSCMRVITNISEPTVDNILVIASWYFWCIDGWFSYCLTRLIFKLD